MPINISFKVFITCVIGWSLPTFFLVPGIVISITSSLSFSSSSFAVIAAFFVSISLSRFCLISFANAPIIGLSSADSLPIPLRTAVSSPFLPIYLIRISSSASNVTASFNAVSTDALICCSCSFISIFLSFRVQKNRPNALRDEKYLPRYHPNSDISISALVTRLRRYTSQATLFMI